MGFSINKELGDPPDSVKILLEASNDVVKSIVAQEEKIKACLANEDLGDSLDSVKILINNHKFLENLLAVQEENLKLFDEFASKIIKKLNETADEVTRRRTTLLGHGSAQLDKSNKRRIILQESYCLHQFERDCHELKEWIYEKLTTATDEGHLDITDVNEKVKENTNLEVDWIAKKKHFEDINNTAKEMIESHHYASSRISERIVEILELWQSLVDTTERKSGKLNQAATQQQFNPSIDDIEMWFSKVESELISEDYGKDLNSVQSLMMKHNLLESDIGSHKESINRLLSRCNALQNPLWLRRQRLQDSLGVQQFYKCIDDEEAWIQEKECIAASIDSGHDLAAVQNLIKRHQAMLGDINNHENIVNSICHSGEKMMQEGHFATNEIGRRIKYVSEKWKTLKDNVLQRKQDLNFFLQSHQYFADSNEVELWLNEKEAIVGSQDFGKDEDSTRFLLKKTEALITDIKVFGNTISSLKVQAQLCKDLWEVVMNDRQGLVPAAYMKKIDVTLSSTQQNLADTNNISVRQSQIETKYESLIGLGQERILKLEESFKAYQLLHKVVEFAKWLKDKEHIVQVQAVGEDLEGVEEMQNNLDNFLSDLRANEVRLTELNKINTQLMNSGHAAASLIIQIQIKDVNQKWQHLKEVTAERANKLSAAHELQRFEQDIDKTKDWILEKGENLKSEISCSDLRSIQIMQKKHEELEKDLAVFEDKIHHLNKTASRLESLRKVSEIIYYKLTEINQDWKHLIDKANVRKEKLLDSYNLQQFLYEYRELNMWIEGMLSIVSSTHSLSLATEAVSMMEQLQRQELEMEQHESFFNSFDDLGLFLLNKRLEESMNEKVKLKSEDIKEKKNNLKSIMREKHKELDESLASIFDYSQSVSTSVKMLEVQPGQSSYLQKLEAEKKSLFSNVSEKASQYSKKKKNIKRKIRKSAAVASKNTAANWSSPSESEQD